jgi:hypothetical protein
MSAAAVRRAVVAVCVLGIAGMIAGSVADNTGAALTCGLVTAVAVLCAIVATAVSGPADDEQAARVEAGVHDLVAAGADEEAVRRLVGDAVRLGKGR